MNEEMKRKINLIAKWFKDMDPFDAAAGICMLIHQEIVEKGNPLGLYDLDWYQNFFLKNFIEIYEEEKRHGKENK